MAGSDVESSFIEAAAADTDGVCASQTPGSATNMTINGALADSGSVTFDQPRNLTIASAGDDSGKTFTVTGTDETGQATKIHFCLAPLKARYLNSINFQNSPSSKLP